MTTQIYKYLTITIIYLSVIVKASPALKTEIENVEQYISVEKIEAENLSSGSNYVIYENCADESGNIFYVWGLGNDTVLEYDDVFFGTGVQIITIRLSDVNPVTEIDINLHVGSATNPPIGNVKAIYTGEAGTCSWQTFVAQLDVYPSGLQDLFLTFPSSTQDVLGIDWFYFNQTRPENY